MNEKGFAATGILYTILVLFILLFAGILMMLSSRNNILIKLQKDVKTEIQGGSTCTNMIGKTWNFDYNGSEQKFTAPCDGLYRIEAWGAQGYSIDEYFGGYGAYASGNYVASADEVLYVTVGQAGSGGLESEYTSYSNGGIGGSSDGVSYTGSGGGSSHVIKQTGLLSSFASTYTSNVLVIAAGGGSASWTEGDKWAGYGGHGGGISGVAGKSVIGTYKAGGGATQTSGGAAGNSGFSGSFGVGANNNGNGSGGGAGLYGGGSSFGSGSGGGSSYVGNASISNGIMYCYSCTESSEEKTKTVSTTDVSSSPVSQYAKIGNGYVRITLVSV